MMTPTELQTMLDERFPNGAQVASVYLDGGDSIYDPDLLARFTARLVVMGPSSEGDQLDVRVVDVYGNHEGMLHVGRVEEYDGADGLVLYREDDGEAWRVTSHLEPGVLAQIRLYVETYPEDFEVPA